MQVACELVSLHVAIALRILSRDKILRVKILLFPVSAKSVWKVCDYGVTDHFHLLVWHVTDCPLCLRQSNVLVLGLALSWIILWKLLVIILGVFIIFT